MHTTLIYQERRAYFDKTIVINITQLAKFQLNKQYFNYQVSCSKNKTWNTSAYLQSITRGK